MIDTKKRYFFTLAQSLSSIQSAKSYLEDRSDEQTTLCLLSKIKNKRTCQCDTMMLNYGRDLCNLKKIRTTTQCNLSNTCYPLGMPKKSSKSEAFPENRPYNALLARYMRISFETFKTVRLPKQPNVGYLISGRVAMTVLTI